MGVLEIRLKSSARLLIATPGALSTTVLRAGDKAGLRVAIARLPADRIALGTLRRQWPRLVPGVSPPTIPHIDLVAQLSRMIRNRQLVAALLYDNGVEIPEAKRVREKAAAIHLPYRGGVLLLGRRGAMPLTDSASGSVPTAAVQTILRGLGSSGLRTIETSWPSVFGGSSPGSGPALLQNLTHGLANGSVVARLLPGPSGTTTAALRADAPKPIATWSSLDKIAEAMPRSGKFLSGDLKAFVAIFRDPMVAVKMAGGMLALLALQAVPVVGAAVDTAILVTLAWTIGWEAGKCIDALVRATIQAVDAKDGADLDRAARLYANAFEAMGTAALSALTARFMLRTRGAAAAKAEAAAKKAEAAAARTRPPPPPTKPPPPPKATAGPSTILGSEEAVASKRVYAEAFNAKEDLVIGRLPDTKAGAELGMRRLDSPFWNPKVNDAWIQGGIDANKPFYLGSNPTIANLRSADAQYPTTVFMRELQQLKAAGYTRQGMWLLPPKGP